MQAGVQLGSMVILHTKFGHGSRMMLRVVVKLDAHACYKVRSH